jgi:hypothetical protein
VSFQQSEVLFYHSCSYLHYYFYFIIITVIAFTLNEVMGEALDTLHFLYKNSMSSPVCVSKQSAVHSAYPLSQSINSFQSNTRHVVFKNVDHRKNPSIRFCDLVAKARA